MKKIFITGGAGFLGKNLVERYYRDNEITIFSRDEAKHYFLKKKYPNIKCIIGDITDRKSLISAGKNNDIGIFAASMKQISAVDENFAIASKIIIDGAINSRICAEENGFESACFISSDKSRAATTLYGAMKFVAGESFIVNADNSTTTRLSTAIYGNVINSTGSIIPLIWSSIQNKYSLQLYSNEMTRFFLTTEEAIDLIEFSLSKNGFNVIPVAKSFKIKDLFEIFEEKFGLKYTIGFPRVSEKIHEVMIAEEEFPRTKIENGYYIMHYKNIVNNNSNKSINYSSKNVCISKNDLFQLLEKNNFFKP